MKLFFAFIACILVIQECSVEQTPELDYALTSMQQESYYIPLSGWTVQQKIVFNDSLCHYDLIRKKYDTLYNIKFDVLCNKHMPSEAIEYKIAWFEKIYFDSSYSYNLIFQDDTAIFYKSSVVPNSPKEFILGKYYYMLIFSDEFLEMGYTGKHLNYIHNNLDSLKQIRGDSLVFNFESSLNP